MMNYYIVLGWWRQQQKQHSDSVEVHKSQTPNIYMMYISSSRLDRCLFIQSFIHEILVYIYNGNVLHIIPKYVIYVYYTLFRKGVKIQFIILLKYKNT